MCVQATGEEEACDLFRRKRFYLAAILLTALIICAVSRAVYRAGKTVPHEPPASSAEPPPEMPAAEADDAVTSAAGTQSRKDGTAPGTEAVTEEDEAVCRADAPYLTSSKLEELKARVRLMQETCSDFIGWLYVADSEMDLPVVQGTDNDYYLSHAPDGSEINEGTVFLDCHSSRDLSDLHNVLYGHNMSAGMFGDIRSFKDQAEFDRHRYGWFLTPDTLFRIDFFALAVVSTYDTAYDMKADHAKWLESVYSHALFTASLRPAENERILALSTCSVEFRNARALFTGRLVPVTDESEIILSSKKQRSAAT